MSRVIRVRTRLRAMSARPAAKRQPEGMAYRAEPVETREDGLVVVPVRAISAELVHDRWIDHRDPEHLERAVVLLERVPIMPMHDADPRNLLGYTQAAKWDATPLGPQESPGINVEAVLDPEYGEDARKVGRGVAARVLTRWSLGFLLDAEISHPSMDDQEFECQLGQEIDGEVVRLIAREIVDISELSVVDIGAIESARTLASEVRPWERVDRPTKFATLARRDDATPKRRPANPPAPRRKETA